VDYGIWIPVKDSNEKHAREEALYKTNPETATKGSSFRGYVLWAASCGLVVNSVPGQ
jgi:hypothetical protein